MVTGSDQSAQIRTRLEKIKNDIRIATEKSGRGLDSVKLVVVTKGHPAAAVEAAIHAGAENLGENYVQEALQKMGEIDGGLKVNWHMIGHIQSRKASAVVENFDLIHSLDSLKLARRLNRFAGERDKRIKVLLEYNVSGEAAKFGWDATHPDRWQELAADVRELYGLEHLELSGLMTMAPYFDDGELARPTFRKLRELAEWLRVEFGTYSFPELSMGMSQDFQVAIEEGATIVRIGTAVMGPRPVK